MQIVNRWYGFGLLVLGMFMLGFSPLGAQEASPKKIKVFVSIPPQAYFVEQVGGDEVEIEVLVSPGQSPATFEPTPKQMTALAAADIYFPIGVPFEKRFLPKVVTSCPNLALADTRTGIELQPLHPDHHGEHSGLTDPHTWLDPKLVKIQAENIARGLTWIEPSRETTFEENLRLFQAELTRLDSVIAEVLMPLRGRNIYVFHPSYGYFTAAYGLRQIAVELGGKEPGARQLVELIAQARKDSVQIIFVQPQFSQKSAETIAKAINGVVVPLDPLARDYSANMELMAQKIKQALSSTAGK